MSRKSKLNQARTNEFLFGGRGGGEINSGRALIKKQKLFCNWNNSRRYMILGGLDLPPKLRPSAQGLAHLKEYPSIIIKLNHWNKRHPFKGVTCTHTWFRYWGREGEFVQLIQNWINIWQLYHINIKEKGDSISAVPRNFCFEGGQLKKNPQGHYNKKANFVS